MILFRRVAVPLGLLALVGLTICAFQFMLTLAYGLWGLAFLYCLGLGLSGAAAVASVWLWKQESA